MRIHRSRLLCRKISFKLFGKYTALVEEPSRTAGIRIRSDVRSRPYTGAILGKVCWGQSDVNPKLQM